MFGQKASQNSQLKVLIFFELVLKLIIQFDCLVDLNCTKACRMLHEQYFHSEKN